MIVAVFALNRDSKHPVTGTLELTDSSGFSGVASCSGDGGYEDIDVGADVVVRDGDGETLASSSLGSGREVLGSCVFDFKLDVPDSDFYEIEVSHRGGLTYSREELDARNWQVALTLG